MKLLTILLALVLLTAPTLWPGSVSLLWDASTTPTVTGYKIYYGNASHTYTKIDVVPNQTSWTVENLPAGTWYFAATATDSEGNESDFSNEVTTTLTNGIASVTLTLNVIPAPGPRITLLLLTSITSYNATVTWQTSTECDGLLLYGSSASNLNFQLYSNHLGTTDHQATTYPLVSRTHYFYKVRSVCNGTTIESETRSFNTK